MSTKDSTFRIVLAVALLPWVAHGNSCASWWQRLIKPSIDLRAAWSRYLPKEPDLPTVETWFDGALDSHDRVGETLYQDPAFRQAFSRVLLKRIQSSDLAPAKKKLLEAALRDEMQTMAAGSPLNLRNDPRMRPEEINRRRAQYEMALAAYFEAKSGRLDLHAAWSRYLPVQPDLTSVENWFKSVFDPHDRVGASLFHDPAFRRAFSHVLLKRILASDLAAREKELLVDALRDEMQTLSAADPLHPRNNPAMNTEAVNRRGAEYETALEAFFDADSFRQLWSKDMPAYPELKKIEEKLTELLKKNVALDPETLEDLRQGRSPLLLDPLARETFLDVAGDLIEHALLPRREKDRLRERLRAGLAAMTKEQQLWARQKPRNSRDPRAEIDHEMSDEKVADLKKQVETYLKSERFHNCVGRTLRLAAASTLVSDIAGSLGIRDEVGDPSKSFTDQALDPGTYWRGTFSRRLGPLIVWDALLSVSIGGLRCVNTQAFAGNSRVARWALKRENLNGLILGPLTGALAELFTGSTPKVRDAILGALWIRYVSLYKTAAATHLARKYQEAGLPGPGSFDFVIQLMSESIGAYFFPQLQRLVSPNDDDKKKRSEKDREKEQQ